MPRPRNIKDTDDSIELGTSDTCIQWRRGNGTWIDLIELSLLTGAHGNDGQGGAAGVDGKSVELQVSGGYIQWRQTGGTWQNLIAVSSLVGAKGDKGDKGNTGDTGPQGNPGTAGSAGAAATIAIGTVTTGAAGSSATVVNAGTSSAATLNFAIPKGADGTNGTNAVTLVGTVTLAESSLITASLSVRRLTLSLTGTVTTGSYQAVPTAALPTGFSIQDCFCGTNGQITVGVLVPVLALATSYSIPVKIYKLN